MIRLSKEGCAPVPERLTIISGYVTFTVVNRDAPHVTTLEISRSNRALDKVGPIGPGGSTVFWLRLTPGSYVLSCPDARHARAKFILSPSGPGGSVRRLLRLAAARYDAYLRARASDLLTESTQFASAVDHDQFLRARLLYPKAHTRFEQLEVVAKSWPELARQINGTLDDFSWAYQFTGFHRLEKALWSADSLQGMRPVAEELLRNVRRLRTDVDTLSLGPTDLADDSVILLTDLETLEVTGEEEVYSLTDLADIKAQVDSSFESYRLLRAALSRMNPGLAHALGRDYANLYRALRSFQRHPGVDQTGYVRYANLYQIQGQRLAMQIDPVAEAMSQVPELIG